MIRLAKSEDLSMLLQLYTQLHENKLPKADEKLHKLWADILNDKNHKVIVCEQAGSIVSSCIMIIVPNLTHNQRPYALIENVITDINFRNKGFSTACLDFARNIAIECNCYKIMLMTGAKDESTLNFYKHAGYNCTDKTAFIQWL